MPQYNGVWTIQAAAQEQSNQQWVTAPNFRNTTLLLQADNAANGAQNNTFLDSSSNSFAITRNGNTTQGTFTPFSQASGRWSNFCATAGTDYLNLGSNANFSFGTGAYTIEFFVYRTANGSTDSVFASIEASGTGWYVGTNLNAGVALNLRGTGAVVSTNSYQIPLNTWTHVVITRASTSANQTRIFINGVLAVAGTDANNWSATGALLLMNTGVGGYNAAGYLSNVRLIKGSIPTAYQTSSTTAGTSVFTSPTTELTTSSQGATSGNVSLLTCQNNRFVDNSATGATVTPTGTPSVQPFSPFAPQFQWTAPVIGGSGSFSAAGDYLTAPYSTTDLDWFTSGVDYTIEAWIMVTGAGWQAGGSSVVGNMSATTGTNYWSFGINASIQCQFSYFNGAGQTVTLSSVTSSYNQWMHIAMCKTSSGIQLFANGVGGTVTAISGTPQSSTGTPLTIGQFNGVPCPGYISNVRIVKGTALYSGSTYTIPTAPATAVTNTKLLVSATNAGIYDGKMANNLQTVGNAQVSTSVVKYGSGSMAFDGTGDYLTTASAQNAAPIGTGDCTVEMWVYLSTTGVVQGLVGNMTELGSAGFSLYVQANNTLRFQHGTTTITSTNTMVSGVWYHVAFARSNSIVNVFVNGVLWITGTATTNLSLGAATVVVGRAYTNTNNYYLNGYLDDLRITAGLARYTANFTPPQVALPRQ